MKTKILHAAFFTPMADGRWGLPLLLWGPPGVAKTAAVRQLARAYGVHCEHLTPGERGEGAFGVTPVPAAANGDGMVLEYPPPEWVRDLRLDTGEEVGIVFLDEINTAPPALQPALLGAIQERRIGGHAFGPRVRALGAANPVGQAAGGWDLAAPVANRLGHLDWPGPTADEWGAWLVGGGEELAAVDPAREEARVLKAWPEAWAKACGLVAAFLRRRPELLHKMPPASDPVQSRAWPSPRTWEYAARARAAAEVHGLGEVEADELFAAFVGQAAATEFAVWATAADLPEPADLLDGRVEWQHDKLRLDRTDAVLGACAALVVPAKAAKRKERAVALWEILAGVMVDTKDMTIPTMQALVRAGLHQVGSATKVMAAAHQVLSEGGCLS